MVSSYNDLKMFSLGGQFMIKTPNSEFFIGSERLLQSLALIKSGFSTTATSNQLQFATPVPGYTGADFFIGYSFKFGRIIERDMNSSTVTPKEEKGFLGRLFENLFSKEAVSPK